MEGENLIELLGIHGGDRQIANTPPPPPPPKKKKKKSGRSITGICLMTLLQFFPDVQFAF